MGNLFPNNRVGKMHSNIRYMYISNIGLYIYIPIYEEAKNVTIRVTSSEKKKYLI